MTAVDRRPPSIASDATPSSGGERGAIPRGGSNPSSSAAAAGGTLARLAGWAAGLGAGEVPPAVRAQAKNQLLSTLAAVHAGFTSELGEPLHRAFRPGAAGRARVVPTGGAAPPAHAAFLMASWSMVLDYDDVMLGGHTGHSTVLVPLAYGTARAAGGAEVLAAQVAANEIAARINMVTALGAVRGQMATHTHLAGAAAARARLERLDPERFAQALGFALSYPATALFPAFLGSDAKALAAAWPLRMGLEAVDAVNAGLAGAVDLLDDRRGPFTVFTRLQVREFLGGLGERWHTATTSFKLYPACGYLSAVLDATLALVHRHRVRAEEVTAVEVAASLFTVGMDAHSAPYVRGPRSTVAALTFSTPYAVAAAILAGGFGPAQLTAAWREDPRVWDLAARVRVRHDAALSVAALTGDLPLGAALRRVGRRAAAAFALGIAGKAFGRGGRLRHPLATLRLAAAAAAAAGGRRPLDLTAATKPLGARVVIATRDGRRLSRTVEIPDGFAGAGDWRRSRRLMREKFVRAAAPTVGADRAAEAAAMIDDLEALAPAELARLVDLNCAPARPAGAVGRARWPAS